MGVELHLGDCRDILRTLPDNSVDSIVTDPPYELGFMNKRWDSTGIAYDVNVWRECLRVLKPGGHLLAFGGSRTYHRLACAVEDAGFEIRDSLQELYDNNADVRAFIDSLDERQRELLARAWPGEGTVLWVYGSGFPKSLDVSKAIDKAAGAERKVVGVKRNNKGDSGKRQYAALGTFEQSRTSPMTAPATPDAETWQGWGTALKPAHEPIIMARKPLSERTVAANVLAWGCGALNVDGCGVPHDEVCRMMAPSPANIAAPSEKHRQAGRREAVLELKPSGRWPANVMHDGSDEVVAEFAKAGNAGALAPVRGTEPSQPAKNVYGEYGRRVGTFYGDSGSAARFFYCAKASKSDRDEGLEGMPEHDAHATRINQTRPICNVCGCGTIIAGPGKQMACGHTDIRFEPSLKDKHGNEEGRRNHHPTVKPTALMRYLVRLVTPPGGVVLDPFMGSGSTGKAAVLEGFGFIGIEKEAEYLAIAERRIEHAQMQPALMEAAE